MWSLFSSPGRKSRIVLDPVAPGSDHFSVGRTIMTRKSTKALRKHFGLPVLVLFAVLIVAAGLTGSSLSQSQQAPTLRIVSEDGNRLPTVVINGNDIRSLPGGTTYIGSANGGVWKTTNGGATADLVKTGAGTLVLPTASQNGVTKTGAGTLKNSENDATTKQGPGTLILSSANDAVYEFRDLTAAEFDQVAITVSGETLTLNGSGFMGRHLPQASLKGWPFKRLLIIPTTGVKDVEGWNGRTSNSGFHCAAQFCECNGQGDCKALVKSNRCHSAMTCSISGSAASCYCDAK